MGKKMVMCHRVSDQSLEDLFGYMLDICSIALYYYTGCRDSLLFNVSWSDGEGSGDVAVLLEHGLQFD